MTASNDTNIVNLHGIQIPRSWLERHLGVFGTTGSGKTLYVVRHILLEVLSQGDAAVIMDVKGDLKSIVIDALAKCGRQADLVVLGAGANDHVYNPLGSSSHPHKLAKEIVAACSITGSMASQKAGGDDLFWATARNELLAALIELATRLIPKADANQPLTFRDLQRLRQKLTQPHSALQLWAKASAEIMSDVGGAALMEFSALADTTRACVLSSVANLIGPFLRPPLSDFVQPMTEKPSLDIHDIFNESKVVVVTAGQAENAAELLPGFLMFKSALYRAVLSRPRLPVRQDTRLMVVLDEYNRMVQAHDFEGSEHVVMEAARSSRVSFVIATQNLSGLEALMGATIVDKLTALTGNLVFLANSCSVTAHLAERCLGTRTRFQRHRTTGEMLPPPLLIPSNRHSSASSNATTLLIPVQEPLVTAAKLARLGPGRGFVKLADGRVHQLRCRFQ